MPADVNLNIDISKKGEGDKEAALGLEALAKSADNAKDQLSQLDRKLLETRAAMVGAGKTFQQTGDISPLKALLKDERQLSTVQKAITRGAEAIAADLENAGNQGGKGFVSRFVSNVEDGLGKLSGTAPQGLVAWLVAGAAAAAPAIGAAISAGVLLGVGGVGIGAGLAGAAQDPRVRAAFVDLGGFAKQQLIDASTGFVGPAVVAADRLKTELGKIGPQFKGDLDAVAPSLNNLVDGLTGFIEKMQSHGLGDAFKEARPAIDALAQELPAMGAAVGDFFHDIAAGGPGAVQFIHDFSTGVQVTLENVGLLTEGLTKTYDFVRSNPFGQLLSPLSEGLNIVNDNTQKSQKSLAEYNAEGYRAVQILGQVTQAAQAAGLGVQLTGDDFKSLSKQINETAATSDLLAGAMSDRLFNAMLSQDHAALGVATSLTALGDSLKQNTVSARNHAAALDINTASGQANRSAVLNAVAANVAEYDTQIKAGISAKDAAAAYDQNTGALERQLQKAHLTQGQIDGLIGKYKNVPANVDTDIELHGLTQAIDNLTTTLRLMAGLKDKTVTVTVDTLVQTTHKDVYIGGPSPYQQSASAFGARRYGGLVAAAQGMIVNSPTILFGERGTGLEAYIPKLGISDARGLALANQAASWHGGHVVPNGGYGRAGLGGSSRADAPPRRPRVTFAGNTDSAFATAFMSLVRTGLVQIS